MPIKQFGKPLNCYYENNKAPDNIPDTFKYYYKFKKNNAPHDNIYVGDKFKVSHNNETFSVEILGLCNIDRYIVRVDNILVNKHPFIYGDILSLERSYLF